MFAWYIEQPSLQAEKGVVSGSSSCAPCAEDTQTVQHCGIVQALNTSALQGRKGDSARKPRKTE
jgi:hypothetical protein